MKKHNKARARSTEAPPIKVPMRMAVLVAVVDVPHSPIAYLVV